MEIQHKGYPRLQKKCKESDIFTFRNSQEYSNVVEGDDEEMGLRNFNNLKNDYPDYFNKLDPQIFIDDKIGSPHRIINYKNYMVSTGLPRNIYNSFAILNYIKENEIKNLDILEIGGGHGSLAKILINNSKNFNYSINSYTIIDLDEVSEIQAKFSDYFDLNIKTLKYSEIVKDVGLVGNYNLVLSLGCVAELKNKNIQNFYLDNFIKDTEYVYLVWNSKNIPNQIKNFKRKLSLKLYKHQKHIYEITK